ncbi:LysE family translocator [Streptomyces massasporeus]|uniref:LysE family translocator n=1 Tax=Streptomyces massasporeus TaxID=67324 RepID=UPI00167378DF|nr:LysE family translocator [Streptomyces massasporeus]GGV91781.1 threonine transporter RhtB [Streptomyces massasporeus]
MISEVLTFSGVAAGIIVMPGADLAVVLRNALASRRAGLATAVGIVCGLALHTALAAAGLAALLLTSDLLFTTLKLVGAGYLLYLGGKALAACVRGPRPAPPPQEGDENSAPSDGVGFGGGGGGALTVVAEKTGLRQFLLQGFITNAANPKAPVLFLSLMPQFIPRGAPFVPMTLLLSAIVIVCGLLWFPSIAMVAASAGRFLSSPRAGRLIEGVIGVVLMFLAVMLLMESAV